VVSRSTAVCDADIITRDILQFDIGLEAVSLRGSRPVQGQNNFFMNKPFAFAEKAFQGGPGL
jgi:hypothetical protein